jgi:hypothetical protein
MFGGGIMAADPTGKRRLQLAEQRWAQAIRGLREAQEEWQTALRDLETARENVRNIQHQATSIF